jgi:GTP-binding protein
LNALTAAKVKVADYPFTTLAPNLSYIEWEDFTRTFIADIPGIIEGASNGRGLGFQFLKHIDRTSRLLFVIDAAAENPKEQYNVLLKELESYNPELTTKPQIVVLNKIDLIEQETLDQVLKEFPSRIDVVAISAAEKLRLEDLRKLLTK